jgi:hypothetical protein
MRKLVWMGLLVVAAAMAWGQGETSPMPRVVLTRVFDTGGSESLTLRCTPDVKGKQEFFCDILRFRNGVEVATTSLYAKQTRAILASFFEIMPSTATASGPAAKDPSYVWDIAYGEKSAKGYVTRLQKDKDARVMRAVLSLEGALSSQFYR